MITNTPTLIDKIPPQNIEAEKAFLAALLIDRNAIEKVADKINVNDFYLEVHKIIADAIIKLYDEDKPVDLVTVNNALRSNAILERAGGASYLSELTDFIPTSANAEYYLNIIQNKAELRTLIHVCTEIVTDAYHNADEVHALIDSAESKIFEIAKQRIRDDLVHIKPSLVETINHIDKQFHSQGTLSGVSSGLIDLDNLTGGFQKADLIIIAARPSMGKTALVLNITENICMKDKLGVAFFSLEMSKQQLCQRILSSYAKINSQKIRTGDILASDFPKLTTAVSQLSRAKIYLDDTPAISPLEIRAKARRLMAKSPVNLIIVDYLQLISAHDKRKTDTRQNEIAEISRSLKALARELDVPVIALSQLSRSVETRGGDRRPILSDLRESGAIEQDADVVAFIYREEYYHPDDENAKGKGELIIAKQRNGPNGTVLLTFNKTQTRFDNHAKYG